MLEFLNVSKTFKSDLLAKPFSALRDVSFQIPDGAMIGFLGANGAGKTTSIKVILDFIRPDAGEVRFAPHLRTAGGAIDFAKIGYLPERPYFYPHLTGREFATYMGQLSGMRKARIADELRRHAERFRLSAALDRPLRTYSKGMLQRMGFLVTILHDPQLIILDEPLSGLDPVGRLELKEIMVQERRAGKTVFFSSHIVPDVEEICDRVIFLRAGQLVYDGSVDKLLREHLRQSYVLAVPAGTAPPPIPVKDRERSSPEFVTWEVAAEHKDALVRELAARDVPIFSLVQERPSLEEIFYHIKR